jgi:transcriptional regulator with XRE-family HTH domain
LRQVDLAERLERPQSFVSKYEAGERRLDLVELREIAYELGTNLPRLVQLFERELSNRPQRSRRR